MRALGIFGGIGSMMIGAKKQGWDIIGNVEYRPYFHTGTFEHNFPGAFLVKKFRDLSEDQIEECTGVDLIIGHTYCGRFSGFHKNKGKALNKNDVGDIPEFIESVKKLSPKFFIMDNNPKSLIVVDWVYWSSMLPDYDIHFEHINNYGYGNVQKSRRRLFVIGSKKELGFYFIPGEFNHNKTIRDKIQDLKDGAPNHDRLNPDSVVKGWSRYNFEPEFIGSPREDNILTVRELQDYIRDTPVNKSIPRYNRREEIKQRIGFMIIDIDRHAGTLTGGGSAYDNRFRSDTMFPFTIRERARIQGCPDDFIFIPTGIDENVDSYRSLIKQTGKFIPVEACTHATGQIKTFLEGTREDKDYTGKRTVKSDPNVDRNKFEYCQIIGYSNQKKVCQFCGSKEYCKQQIKIAEKEIKNGTNF